MRYPAIFLLFLFLTIIVRAQDKERNVFIELGGSGGLGSLNYEQIFKRKIRNHTGWDGDDGISPVRCSFRCGISTTPIDKNNGWVVIFPSMVNLIYGKGSHKAELGGGFAPSITTKGAFFIKSPLLIGYRYQNSKKKFFYRISYTPLFAWLVDYQWQHWAGVSIGYRLS